ncbi:MAG: hypothetical protein AVDCRST_MAG77-1541 [uncultured Chloroflexi bacterium]|uniref:Helix-turn-helix domain-containing protein n=1 Tax=uncultured Chloroflexota bacterium TaxID=166587 RepID=A0A6J4I348_9CHLR|nr:MAG: hypothetical protein AVDCRST_MAG77-1541 [uncultured Chloroflexota bacterium]
MPDRQTLPQRPQRQERQQQPRTGTGLPLPEIGATDNDPRYRFLARFGATILSGGIAAIPMALYHYQADLVLVPQEVWFVGYILAHRWTADLPYPSLRRMSRRTGVSTQMLHRYKQSLIEKGYLATIARHRPSGGRTSNYYDFTNLFHALEQLLTRDRRGAAWQPSADESLDGDDGDDGISEGRHPEESGHRPGEVFGVERSSRPTRAVPQSHRPVGSLGIPSHAPPDQSQLSGGWQGEGPGALSLALIAPEQGPVTGAARHKHPRNQSPLVQSVVTEPLDSGRSAARAEAPAPTQPIAIERSLQDDETPRTPRTDEQWELAKRTIASQLSPAAFSAWIAPLRPEAVPAPTGSTSDQPHDGPTPAMRLRCDTPFQRQQVERRYLELIETALGCVTELVVAEATTATLAVSGRTLPMGGTFTHDNAN